MGLFAGNILEIDQSDLNNNILLLKLNHMGTYGKICFLIAGCFTNDLSVSILSSSFGNS